MGFKSAYGDHQRPLSTKELNALPEDERKLILAWRESVQTGKKISDSYLKTNDPSSLEIPYAQLRQNGLTRQDREKALKKLLKEKGILFGDSIEATELYFKDEWDKLLEDYDKWRAAMENCFLVMKNREASTQMKDNFIRSISKDKKGIVAQCQTRFSPGKRKVTHWRMDEFSKKVMRGGNRYGLEITLTTDPKRFKDLDEVGEKWKFFIEKFMDFCTTRLRRAGKKGLYCYLKACELTESGLLHVHVGFFGPGLTGKKTKVYASGKIKQDYIFPQSDISKIWDKYGIGKITWIKKKPVNDLTDYVTKHVAKTWGSYDSNEMLEAFLYYTGMRQWTSSKGAIPKPPPALERWDLIAVAFSPGEAILFREDLLKDGFELIQDDIKMLEMLNSNSGSYPK